MSKITVKDKQISVIQVNDEDYLCLTDMLKAKEGDFFITDWLRNKNTLEYIGIWEQVYNPVFNCGEFATIKNESGLNRFRISVKEFVKKTNAIKQYLIHTEITPVQKSFIYADEADMLNVALFGMTAKQWRDNHPELNGNIRDYATINQLICLSNLENLNAVLINDGLNQIELRSSACCSSGTLARW